MGNNGNPPSLIPYKCLEIMPVTLNRYHHDEEGNGIILICKVEECKLLLVKSLQKELRLNEGLVSNLLEEGK